ncbi:unnamed protein product [Alopecurus aequalis]
MAPAAAPPTNQKPMEKAPAAAPPTNQKPIEKAPAAGPPTKPKPIEKAPAASPSWVILGSVPRVLSAAAELPQGAADFSLTLPPPPRVALLTIPPRVFPGRPTPSRYPSVVAADPSGLLLLHADQGHAKRPTVTDTPRNKQFPWRPFLLAGYFVLDATAPASAFPLPKPQLIKDPGRVGLIASPEGEGYMVAELQPVLDSDDKALLLRFSSQDGEWVSKTVDYPLPARCPFSAIHVLSCSGRLWWVDLSWGLLTCDPFADEPVLTAVHLPEGKALNSGEPRGELDKYRCVGVSAGKLRFIDTFRNRNNCGGATQISVWTLADHPEESWSWSLEYEATFAEICADPSYKATGLRRKIPAIVMIHPNNPDVVYFVLDRHLVGINVRARKVVECEVYQLPQPPIDQLKEHVAGRYLHPWKLPPALCSGSAKEETFVEGSAKEESDDGLTEMLQQLQLGGE